MSRKIIGAVWLCAAVLLAAALLAGCGTGPAGPAGPAGADGSLADLTCTECHNDSAILAGKLVAWEGSAHGSGTSTAYAGARVGCAGCHSGGVFTERIAAGEPNPDTFDVVYVDPSRPDCRACHQIHTTYTEADWALETTAPVPLYAFEDVTYDGGMGNLCANCHQPRETFASTDGMFTFATTHDGPHHGPQAAILLGQGGAGVEGTPGAHVTMVADTCVTCHMVGESHSFTARVAACTACHADAEDFDINGFQTEIEAKIEELKAALIAKGMLTEEDVLVVGEYSQAEGAALWNYITIAHEDKSMGIHNPTYINALLDYSLDALK